MLRVAIVWYVTIHVSSGDVSMFTLITSLSLYIRKHGHLYMEETVAP